MKKYNIITFCLIVLVLVSCEKEIPDPDVNSAGPRLVVEGRIEQGLPPIVLLSKSQGYFDPADLNTLSNLYISNGATVTVNDGSNTFTLNPVNASSMSSQELSALAQVLVVDTSLLRLLDFPAFTNGSLIGQIGNTYKLTIDFENNTYEGITSILNPIPLDTAWFESDDDLDDPDLGFIRLQISDPPGRGNAYVFAAKRTSIYTSGPYAGEVKDQLFIEPDDFPVLSDEFIDGDIIEDIFERGVIDNSDKPDDIDDDNNEEYLRFRRGDSVTVRLATIDFDYYTFLNSIQEQQATSGNPFASPVDVKTNMTGGCLGGWGGYAYSYHPILLQ